MSLARRILAITASLAALQGIPAPPALAGDASGLGAHGATIPAARLQRLIDAARPGDVIDVPDAVYVGHVVVRAPITLRGHGGAVLDGGGEGSVVTITAPDVTLRGLAVRGSGPGPIGSASAIHIENADRARVDDVDITQSYIGITVRTSANVVIDSVRITGPARNAIVDQSHAVTEDHHEGADHAPAAGPAGLRVRGDGIWLWNTVGAAVRNTSISDVRDGIYVSFGSGAVLDGNTIEHSRYAVHDMFAGDLVVRSSTLRRNLSGVVLMYGGPVLVEGNTISENGSPSTGFGVLVKDAADVTVARNVIAGNRVGIHLDNAGRTRGGPASLSANSVAVNHVGITLLPSADGSITGNAFVENWTQVGLGGDGTTQVEWSSGGVGNHWSDYNGFDADRDGIGDVAYVQSGRVSRLLADEPLLMAFASSPAFRLLTAVEQRWAPADPIVVDTAPRMSAAGAPRVAQMRPAPATAVRIPGLLVVAGAAAALMRAQPRRKRHRKLGIRSA